MTRAELADLLAVERFAPGPRRPRTAHCEPPEPVTEEQAAAHRKSLEEAIDGTEAAVLPLRRKGVAA